MVQVCRGMDLDHCWGDTENGTGEVVVVKMEMLSMHGSE